MNALPKIVLIGAGNVGFHLGHRIIECKLPLLQVFSRGRSKASRLSKSIEVPYTTKLNRISPNADIYLLAVKDDAITEVANQLQQFLPADKIIAHTSGATPLKALGNYFKTGIFYPLQTFSVDREANFEQLPMCVYSKDQSSIKILKYLADQICPNVNIVNDEQRAALHVAAVFVNNFTNHLFHIGEQFSLSNEVPFDLLKPLIQETVNKIQNHSPSEMQTGPALRGDKKTIKRHLKALNNQPDYQEIYRLLTSSINPKMK